MNAPDFCPTCNAAQGIRIHCCPAAAAADLERLTAENAALADEVRRLKYEVEVLEALRVECMQEAESQGVYLDV